MKLLIMKTAWGVWDQPILPFLERVVAEDWSGTEIYLHGRPESVAEIEQLHADVGLPLIGQISTQGRTFKDHLSSLREQYLHLLPARPLKICSQTGRDTVSFEENLHLFQEATLLEKQYSIPICHETHRGRALFNVPVIAEYLKALPELRLTLDISHLFCVHESSLEDQEENLALILNHVGHIHGRIGYCEGPQVPDPRLNEYQYWVDRSLEIWKRIFQKAKERREESFTISPEFGPFPYQCGIAEQWELNLWMRDLIRKEIKTFL